VQGATPFSHSLAQFAVHYNTIMAATHVSMPFLDPDDTSNTPDGPFNPTPLNSATFLMALCVTLNVFVCNYEGHPFMQSMGENKLLSRGLGVGALLLVMAAVEAFPPLNDLMQLGPMPDADLVGLEGAAEMPEWGVAVSQATGLGLKGCIVAIMAVDTVASYAVERAVRLIL
jgi:magnesium-transporting ATPase (P-type)